MSVGRRVEGDVLRLKCDSCGKEFAHFQFSGDSDVSTAGLGSLSSCARGDVVLASMEASEWNDYEGGGTGHFAQRISASLRRDDLRFIRLVRAVPQAPSARGMSFSAYSEVYKPPKLIFSCACCGTGESQVVEEMTAERFREAGGHIEIVGALTL